ncbi:MAG: YlbF family regulator [Gemmatimonadales bacterium]|nr:YlbF family regulator [Gemmatimonadales bacterium]
MITEKAQDLGRQIGQSTEYQTLRRAEKALREDADAQRRLEAIQRLARQVDQLMAQGSMPDDATAQAYEDAVRELELSTTGQAYAVARANFEKLMTKVNEEIAAGMEKGAASSIITL